MILLKRTFSLFLIMGILLIGIQLSIINTHVLSNSYINTELSGTLGDDDLPPPLVGEKES
ncbi:hypothetical protein [Virgibacillus doumboii]|uniref:hypothetical protein n=1 Tax=Virgibacillus doumboii TaxID=2697503 RepID=UPI0013E032FF|nr:hypothetical protein [Virgibacillus doumboii]